MKAQNSLGWGPFGKQRKFTLSYPLPIQLASFKASALAPTNSIQLSWSTLSETNNYGFHVQGGRSRTSLSDLAFVPGHGTNLQQQSYVWTGTLATEGSYYYRLRQVDLDQTSHLSDIVSVEVTAPVAYTVEQNYPNPFNPATTIRYSLPYKSPVQLTVFNTLGQQVASLVQALQEAGSYEVTFDGSGLASGMYFYRLQAGTYVNTKKLLLLK